MGDTPDRDPRLDPQAGDSATLRGVTWAVVDIEHHLNGDVSWLRLTNPNARRGRLKSVVLVEWQTNFKNHQRSSGSSTCT